MLVVSRAIFHSRTLLIKAILLSLLEAPKTLFSSISASSFSCDHPKFFTKVRNYDFQRIFESQSSAGGKISLEKHKSLAYIQCLNLAL